VLARFNATQSLNADSSPAGQFPLRQASRNAITNDLSGQRGASVFDCGIVAVGIRRRQHRQFRSFGKSRETVVFLAFNDDKCPTVQVNCFRQDQSS
jgi:hypothetical protein